MLRAKGSLAIWSYELYQISLKHRQQYSAAKQVEQGVVVLAHQTQQEDLKQEQSRKEKLLAACNPLRKHPCSNILKTWPPKSFQMKISDTFHTSAQNVDCGYTLEPPTKPQFYFIKVGFKECQNYIGMFSRWKKKSHKDQTTQESLP